MPNSLQLSQELIEFGFHIIPGNITINKGKVRKLPKKIAYRDWNNKMHLFMSVDNSNFRKYIKSVKCRCNLLKWLNTTSQAMNNEQYIIDFCKEYNYKYQSYDDEHFYSNNIEGYVAIHNEHIWYFHALGRDDYDNWIDIYPNK